MQVRLVMHPDDRRIDAFGMRMAMRGDIWIPCRHMFNRQKTPALKFPIYQPTNVPWHDAKDIIKEMGLWYLNEFNDHFLFQPVTKTKEKSDGLSV